MARIGGDGLTDKERQVVADVMNGSTVIGAVRKHYNYTSEKAASVASWRIMKRPRVQKAIRELFKFLDKDQRLKRKELIKSLSDSVGRDLHDLAEVCPAVLKIPKQAHAYISGIKVRQNHGDPEDPDRVTSEDIEIRIAPVAVDRDQAFKIKGMYKPEKSVNVNVNAEAGEWARLLKAAADEAEEQERQQSQNDNEQ